MVSWLLACYISSKSLTVPYQEGEWFPVSINDVCCNAETAIVAYNVLRSPVLHTSAPSSNICIMDFSATYCYVMYLRILLPIVSQGSLQDGLPWLPVEQPQAHHLQPCSWAVHRRVRRFVSLPDSRPGCTQTEQLDDFHSILYISDRPSNFHTFQETLGCLRST